MAGTCLKNGHRKHNKIVLVLKICKGRPSTRWKKETKLRSIKKVMGEENLKTRNGGDFNFL